MLTKLDAVNIVLNAIGETPVSSLTSGLPDAEAAESKLDATIKEVLAKGWQQNLERGIVMNRNKDNEIIVPRQYLRVDTVAKDKIVNVVIRKQNGKRKLFDLSNYTYKFERDLTVDAIIEIEYESLIFELQNYIAMRAARKFQESAMGSQSLDGFAVRQESEAYAALLDAEAEGEDNNILRDSAHVFYATYRNHPLSGR
jgi:hypothetical protein